MGSIYISHRGTQSHRDFYYFLIVSIPQRITCLGMKLAELRLVLSSLIKRVSLLRELNAKHSPLRKCTIIKTLCLRAPL